MTAITELMDRVEREAQERNEALQTFLATHRDFDDSVTPDNQNGELMRMKLDDLDLPATPENLHTAYLELKRLGILKLRGQR